MSCFKHFACVNCSQTFVNRGGSQWSNHRYPLLLTCGHSVCKGCLKDALKLQKTVLCPECHIQMDLPDGESSIQKLMPDIYALGALAVTAKEVSKELKVQLIPSGHIPTPRKVESHKNTASPSAICDECTVRIATWRCEKCMANFCSVCFDVVHKGSKVMKQHMGKPLFVEEYRRMIQSGCEEHERRPIEYYCETDNQVACSYCVVMGDHKGHQVITLSDKNASCSDDLKAAIEDSSKICRRLKYTEMTISKLIPLAKLDTVKLAQEVHARFHVLHSLLELREADVISRLEEAANAGVTLLESSRQDISDNLKEVQALLEDAQNVRDNSFLSINAIDVIKKLNCAKEIPCHLVPTSAANEADDIRIHFSPDASDVFRNFGKIEADIKRKFVLMAEHELPPEYVVEELDDDTSTVHTDTESVSSLVGSTPEESRISPVAAPKSESLVSKPARYSLLKQQNVFVTHISHPGSFWIQFCSDHTTLKSLSAEINRWCRSPLASISIPPEVKQGEVYLAQYSADKKWYRARVKKILTDSGRTTTVDNLLAGDQPDTSETPVVETQALTELSLSGLPKEKPKGKTKTGTISDSEPKAEVVFLDFGNMDILPFSSLRSMQQPFLNIPFLAFHCALWNIVPAEKGGPWSHEATKMFAKFAGNKKILMKVVEDGGGMLLVDLCSPACAEIEQDIPVSVRDALVFLELACFESPCSVDVPGMKVRQQRQYFPAERLRLGQKMNVVLTHLESPSCLYVQELGNMTRYFSKLMSNMDKKYMTVTGDLLAVYAPRKGMICAAQYSKDNQWYRARVETLLGGSMLKVFYVDFGNKETVVCWKLRKILDEYMKLPEQAINCCLADVAPPEGEEWPEKAEEIIKELGGRRQLTLEVHSIVKGIPQVTLHYTEDDEEFCINSLLVQKGVAISSGPLSSIPEGPCTRATSLQESDKPVRMLGVPMIMTAPIATPMPKVREDPVRGRRPHSKRKADVKKKDNRPSSAPTVQMLISETKTETEPKFKMPSTIVQVSHIIDPHHFYVQVISMSERLDGLNDELQQVYNRCATGPLTWQELQLCAVLHLKNKKWYRGQIAKVMSNDQFEVFFLDYGNTDVVPMQHLRPLMDSFQVDKPFACRCHLAGVVPAGDSKNWSRAACEFLTGALSAKGTMHLSKKGEIENNSIPVDILVEKFCPGGALEPSTIEFNSVTRQLQDAGLAIPIRRGHAKGQPAPKDGGSDDTVPGTSTEPIESKLTSEISEENVAQPIPTKPSRPVLHWKPAVFPAEECVMVLPTYVAFDGSVFLQLLGSGTDKIKLINTALEMTYTNTGFSKLEESIVVGQACVALFALDNKWYRAEVLKVQEQHIEVLFVDYGNNEWVTLDNIRTPLLLMEIPRQCIQCDLFGVEPESSDGEWPNTTLDFIHTNIVEKPCTMVVKAKPTPEKRAKILLNLDDTIELTELLVSMGVARPSLDMIKIVEIIQSSEANKDAAAKAVADVVLDTEKTMDEENIDNSSPYPEPVVPKVGETIPVVVSELISPDMLYIQRRKVSDSEEMDHNREYGRFLELISDLAQHAEGFSAVTEAEIGMAYCGKYTYDDKWYRCLVMAVEEEKVFVQYVDYGNCEVIAVDRLRHLPDKYLMFPVQSMLCKLHRVMPTEDEWTDEARQSMHRLLFEQKLELFARVQSISPVLEIDLLTSSDLDTKDNLAYQSLVDQGVVSLQQTLQS